MIVNIEGEGERKEEQIGPRKVAIHYQKAVKTPSLSVRRKVEIALRWKSRNTT